MQGTAADIIKIAMVRVAHRLEDEGFAARMILQVHDELDFECPEDEVERLIAMVRAEMEGVVTLAVPLVADCLGGYHLGRREVTRRTRTGLPTGTFLLVATRLSCLPRRAGGLLHRHHRDAHLRGGRLHLGARRGGGLFQPVHHLWQTPPAGRFSTCAVPGLHAAVTLAVASGNERALSAQRAPRGKRARHELRLWICDGARLCLPLGVPRLPD